LRGRERDIKGEREALAMSILLNLIRKLSKIEVSREYAK
jgi:hypothetical protein